MTDALEIPAFLRRTRSPSAPLGRMSLAGVRLGSAPLPPASLRDCICELCGRSRGPFPIRRPLRVTWRAQMELAL